MSIDDGRSTGGNADSGYFTPSQAPYGSASDATTVLSGSDYDYDDTAPGREPHQWHFGADFGLLILRVTLGALIAGHGLQKVFGIMQGQGITTFAQELAKLGFEQSTILAWVTGVTEIASGALLILGLFTPAAASAVLGVVACAIATKVDIREFAGKVEIEALYAAGAATLLFAGAGKISLDRNTPWFRRAPAFGFVFLLLAAGASVAILLLLR